MAGTPTYTAQADLSSAYADNAQLSGTISITGSICTNKQKGIYLQEVARFRTPH